MSKENAYLVVPTIPKTPFTCAVVPFTGSIEEVDGILRKIGLSEGKELRGRHQIEVFQSLLAQYGVFTQRIAVPSDKDIEIILKGDSS